MKQRLIGAVVLGCLAIIFIPMLLDGDGLTSPELVIEVPVTPLIPAEPALRPARPEPQINTEQHQPAEIMPSEPEAQETLVEAAEPDPTPQFDEHGLPVGWVVRMGAFGERANAEALEETLHELEYKAFLRPVTTSQGRLTAVYVGPLISQAEAERLRAELVMVTDIQGVVAEFSLDE